VAAECVVPELGENISTATVVAVFIAVGQVVALDQPVLSLETDKAEFELPSTVAGKVEELLVKPGDEVSVGQVLFRVGEGTPEARKPSAVSKKPVAAPAAASTVRPSAPSAPQPAPERAAVEPIAQREPAEASIQKEASPSPEAPSANVAAAPSVRRLARELGIDLTTVRPSGAGGRLVAEDLYRHVRDALAARNRGGDPQATQPRDYSRWGPVESEPMSKVRRKTAEQMARAWATIPHVTHHDLADITELDRLRTQYAARVKAAGGTLTVTAILLKVVASALKRHPKFNASIDLTAGTIVYKRYVHLGVAVDTEKGLLVPVIRDADKRNIVELALALREISERARSRNITPEMLEGASFTVTNLGGIGGVAFSPLINPPEVAILGVSRARMMPIDSHGQFVPRLMLPLAVSYDHRAIDGADAARFLRWVCEALEEPFVMDLEGD
jgi:pyruvate dehydrogenase E2 component (dihydrolipoamide acetyltransferase)